VDFPVVWRALAGLDSIAQAAGRCNREGRRDHAVTWVFAPAPDEHPPPRGLLRRTADAAAQVMAMDRFGDLLGLEAIEHYFRLHYWQHQGDWDKQGILEQFHCVNDPQLPFRFNFAEVAERFRFISDSQLPVIVPRGSVVEELVERLRATEGKGIAAPRDVVKRLQRHSVGVRERRWRAALAAGDLELVHERFAVLTAPQLHYSDDLGLRLDADRLYDPNETII